MLGGDGGFATARWREPASSDRLPSHRSESPTGYSSAGCSPAEPASASPVTDNSSSILIQRGNQIRCSTFTAAMQFKPRSSCSPPTGGVISTLRAECHFYLAPTYVVLRNSFMEKVAHRVDENHARLFPGKRLQQPLRSDGEVKAVLERMSGHAAE